MELRPSPPLDGDLVDQLLLKPCGEALIADLEDQLAQLLNGLAFPLREHLQAVSGERTVGYHVAQALGNQQDIVAAGCSIAVASASSPE